MAGRTFTVGIRIAAEDRTSAQIAKIQGSTRGFESAARRLGVTLEKDVNAALRRNAVLVEEAEKAYARGTITLRDFQAIQQRAAAQNDRIRASLEGTTTAANSARGAYAGLSGALNNLALRGAAAYLSLSTLARGLRASVQGSLEQEAAEKRRAIALERAGGASEALVAGLDAQAAALQRVTATADDAVIGLQAYLLELGVSAERTAQATETTLDLAARFDLDLKAAAKGVAGVLRGEVQGRLGDLVPELEALRDSGLLAAEGFDFLSESMRGAARAAGETRAGALKGLANDLGDLGEALADGATRTEGFVGGLGSIRTKVQEITPAIRIFGEIVGTVFSGVITVYQTLGSAIGFVAAKVNSLRFDRVAASSEALEATAARLGITVGELRARLEGVATANIGVVDTSARAGAAAEEMGRRFTITADAIRRLRAEAAGSASAVETLAQTLGVVTSVQLAQEISEIAFQLEAVRQEGSLTSDEFVRLEEIARTRIAALNERMALLRDGLGEITTATVTAGDGFAAFGEEAQGATEEVDRLAASAGRIVTQLDAVGAAAERNGDRLAAFVDPALASRLGTTSFAFAGGRYTFFRGQRVRVLPDGRIEPA